LTWEAPRPEDFWGGGQLFGRVVIIFLVPKFLLGNPSVGQAALGKINLMVNIILPNIEVPKQSLGHNPVSKPELGNEIS
jgi:hypothetical protein